MKKIVDSNISFAFTLRPRSMGGRVVDYTGNLTSIQRHKSIDGSSVGSWSVGLKFDMYDDMDRWLEMVLQTHVEDDDFGNLEFFDYDEKGNEIRSPMEILVVSKDAHRIIDGRGNSIVTYSLSGQDWSRMMTQSQIRLSAMFQSTSVEYVESAAGIEAIYKTMSPMRMPGFIDTITWDQFSKVALEGAAGAGQASVPLKKLMGIMMWGTWKSPEETGKTLIERLESHGWEGFGPVTGSPWQLENITTQNSITPDQVLRQFGCEAFNEIFYDYDKSDNEPAIYFRERPYGRKAWKNLPVVDLTNGQDVEIEVSQTGNERYTFWKPLAAAQGLIGMDQLLDTSAGKIPIIEMKSLPVHGVRPLEIPDDYFPPIVKPNSQFFDWYRIRLGKIRNWYYNNPKMLTGTVTVHPADPRVRIGRRVLLPLNWTFNGGTPDKFERLDTPEIVAYVVNVTDTMNIDERGNVLTSTVAEFTRGQPPAGLPVPPITSWTKGGREVKTVRVTKVGSMILDFAEVATPFPVKLAMGDFRTQITIQPTTPPTVINKIAIGQTGTGSHQATKLLYNKNNHACHFEIDGSGVIYQMLDPVWQFAVPPLAGSGALDADTISINLTGGDKIGFKESQYASLGQLVKALIAHFPTITDVTYPFRTSGSVEDWRTENHLPSGDLPGIFARNQWDVASTSPSSPDNTANVWNNSIRPKV